jgi:hypothetical protein
VGNTREKWARECFLVEIEAPAGENGDVKRPFLLSFLLTGMALAGTYEVGPGHLPSIGDVPWESLAPGDTVLINWRAQPYKEKWVIARQGTAEQPITVMGVPGTNGALPVVEGIDATTRLQLDYWNEERSVVKVGGSSIPSQFPKHIVIENLDIKSGRQPYAFTSDNDQPSSYNKNAASIHIEQGEHITVRNCILRDSGNGLFVGSSATNVLIEKCWIYDNGVEGSYYEHNNYSGANRMVFQFNRFGPLRTGCDGNNLKDRSCGSVIRYNWIESGNRQLDLVDAGESHIYDDPSYRDTYVYGNILVEPDDAGNSQVCHYGGDDPSTNHYRNGTLHFYNNTIVSTRSGNTTLLRLSTENEYADCRNNVIYTTASGEYLAILADTGTADLRNNWLRENWRASHGAGGAGVNDISGNITGTDPGFVDVGGQDYSLAAGSLCINSGADLEAVALVENNVTAEYVMHRLSANRITDGSLDIGAFEHELDSDGDGMPDWWELEHFDGITNSVSGKDPDADGADNRDEYFADTIPTSGASRLWLSLETDGMNSLWIAFPSFLSRVYRMQQSTDLVAQSGWWDLTGEMTGTDEILSVMDTNMLSHGFYRVLVALPK